mgnify:FL=1
MRRDLLELLKANPYPGRGILLGRTPDGRRGVIAYFIMGRSENSRNRVFTEKDGGIITEAADPAKMEDPSLIIYAPVRKLLENTIVTNGDQTDTIYDHLSRDESFEDALRTRTFEPDAPNYTPRISGMLNLCYDGFSYKLSILKTPGGHAQSVLRFFYEYPQPIAGAGHFIHTYQGDGNLLPSFAGEPVPVRLPDDIAAFGKAMWQALDADNKVELFVRAIQLDGSEETWIYNRYEKKA